MWKVYLIDGQLITEQNCNWKLLPNLPIIRLEWQLPNGRTFRMSGFELYAILPETYHIFYGLSKKKIFKDTMNIFGKKGNEVFQFSYSLRFNKAFQTKNQWNKEFRPLQINPIPRTNKKEPKRFTIEFGSPRKTNHSLWHQGVGLNQSIVRIVNYNP